jgi:hypothetical protein
MSATHRRRSAKPKCLASLSSSAPSIIASQHHFKPFPVKETQQLQRQLRLAELFRLLLQGFDLGEDFTVGGQGLPSNNVDII